MREVKDYLAAVRILAFRNQVGRWSPRKGVSIPYGVVGMADLIAYPKMDGRPYPLWIELKAPKNGSQTYEQKMFQQVVESDGHAYIVARSSFDVEGWLRAHGCIK